MTQRNFFIKLLFSPQGLGALLMFAIMLWYWFLPVDLVPDNIPWLGYADDGVAFFIILYTTFSVISPDLFKYFKKYF